MEQHTIASFKDYDRLSSSFNSFDFSSCKIIPSIDFLTFSIPYKKYCSQIISIVLKNFGFEIIRTYKDKNRNNTTNVHAQIRLNGKIYGLFCQMFTDLKRTTFRMINPDIHFFNHMMTVFRDNSYNLTRAEYTLDIYSRDNGKLFDFMSTHAYLKNFKNGFDVPESITGNIRYLNNIRGCHQRGGRIYIKDTLPNSPVRIESIVMNRNFARMDCRSIQQAINLQADQVFNNWNFEYLNYKYFYKNIDSNTVSPQDYKNKFLDSMNGKVNCGGVAAVKNYMKTLKNNPSYYYEKHSFHQMFHLAISGLKFI